MLMNVIPDGISDGSSFPQRIETPFATPNGGWWWQWFV